MNNPRFASAILSVMMVCQYSVLSSAQAETVRDHRRVLGGVNLSQHCVTTYGGGSRALNVNNTSRGWVCRVRFTSRRISEIFVQTACRQQYGRNDLLAEVRSSDDSWVCVVPRAR